MPDVPLLHPRLEEISEPRQIRPGGLEIGERLGLVVIVKIIVNAKLLLRSKRMVEANGELILPFRHVGQSLHWAGSQRGHVFVVKRESRGIETCLLYTSRCV